MHPRFVTPGTFLAEDALQCLLPSGSRCCCVRFPGRAEPLHCPDFHAYIKSLGVSTVAASRLEQAEVVVRPGSKEPRQTTDNTSLQCFVPGSASTDIPGPSSAIRLARIHRAAAEVTPSGEMLAAVWDDIATVGKKHDIIMQKQVPIRACSVPAESPIFCAFLEKALSTSPHTFLPDTSPGAPSPRHSGLCVVADNVLSRAPPPPPRPPGRFLDLDWDVITPGAYQDWQICGLLTHDALVFSKNVDRASIHYQLSVGMDISFVIADAARDNREPRFAVELLKWLADEPEE